MGQRLGVTGASGFLGRAIVSEASHRGWQVTGYSRRIDTQVDGCDEMRSFSDLEMIDLEGIDALVHLSGESLIGLWTPDKKSRIRRSRVDLTADIVTAMEEMPRFRRPQVLVSASATGFYGDRGDDWLDEESDAVFGFLPSVCREWELTALAARRLGSRVVCARLGNLVGAGGMLRPVEAAFRFGFGGKMGTGRQWMPWIHIRDAARAFLAIVENEEIRGAVNVVSPAPVSNLQFADSLSRVFGRRHSFPVPRCLLSLLPGGMGEMFLSSQRVEPVVLRASRFRWDFEDFESALFDARQGGEEAAAESEGGDATSGEVEQSPQDDA